MVESRASRAARVCLLLTAAIAIWPCRLAAQTTHPTDEVRENARSHVGPFYLTPSLELRDLGIDNNVFNEADDPKSDFTFTLVPKADVAVPVGHAFLLSTTLAADFTYYQKYSSERSVSPRVAPRATIFLNRVSIFGEGAYAESRQRPNYEIDVRALRTERAVAGGIGYRFSPNLGIEVSGRRSDVKYDEGERFLDVSLQETLNRQSDIFAAAVRYSVTPLTTIVIKADRTEDRFEFSRERDADTIRVTPGVEFNASALIAGNAYVGLRRFDVKSDAIEDYNGLVASATLAYTLLGRTVFAVNAERDVAYSFERLQPYFVVNSYALTVRHRLSGKIEVVGGAGRYRYTYRDLVVPDAVDAGLDAPDLRDDVTLNYSLSIGYYLGTDVRVGVGASYWTRDSSPDGYRNYDALRMGVSLAYGF